MHNSFSTKELHDMMRAEIPATPEGIETVDNGDHFIIKRKGQKIGMKVSIFEVARVLKSLVRI